jgi:hypothetical protein
MRPEYQEAMVRHQAVAEVPERVPLLGPGQRGEKGSMLVGVGEDVCAIVAAVQGVIGHSVLDRSGESSHAGSLTRARLHIKK